MMKKYQYVGKRIHDERLKYGLSLNDLAKATDLSPSFLSLLENGKTAPSLKVLDKLATYFSIHLAELFKEDQSEEMVITVPKNKQIQVATENNERSLRFLLPKSQSILEPVLITIYPQMTNNEFTSHNGIEFGYVLEGSITICLENRDPIICKEGDSILYQANIPHKLFNPEKKIFRGLWVNVPDADNIKSHS